MSFLSHEELDPQSDARAVPVSPAGLAAGPIPNAPPIPALRPAKTR